MTKGFWAGFEKKAGWGIPFKHKLDPEALSRLEGLVERQLARAKDKKILDPKKLLLPALAVGGGLGFGSAVGKSLGDRLSGRQRGPRMVMHGQGGQIVEI